MNKIKKEITLYLYVHVLINKREQLSHEDHGTLKYK